MNSSFVTPPPIHFVGLEQIPTFCRTRVILVGNNSIDLHNKALGVADGFLPFSFHVSFWATEVQRQSLLRSEDIQGLMNTKAHPLTPFPCRNAALENSTGCIWEGMPVWLLQLPLPLHK